MPLADFIPARRVVEAGGKRFVVQQPTVETVYRFLELYGPEIVSIGRAWEKVQGLGQDPVAVGLPFFVDDPKRLAVVLNTCLEEPLEPDELRKNLGYKLARAVLELCDLPRIVESLDLEAAFADKEPSENGEEETEPAGPTVQELGIVRIAQAFGCSPMDVVRWPWEAFLTVADCLHALEQAAPHARPPAAEDVATADELAALPGIVARKVQ